MSKRIELSERLGSGDTSTVYRATDRGAPVAVKLLHPHLASDPIITARFIREGEILSGIRHPAVLRVYDVVEYDGRPAIVTELLSGGSLCGRIMQPAAAGELLRTLAEGLGVLHGHGIVHRDLRPEHVLFDDSDRPRIIDFGTASVKDLSGLTRSTVYAARPEYIDPYTWGRGRALPIQDIYSLGAIVHTAIMGKAPPVSIFARGPDAERDAMVSDMRDRAGSPLGEIVAAMLDAPARRPRSAAEIVDWLDSSSISGARKLTQCLYCASAMPADAPVCLSCGRTPLEIQLDPDGEYIVLRKISEDQQVLGPFLNRLRLLSDRPLGDVRLIIGDARLYSREERRSGIRLPFRIAEGIHPSSVEPLIQALTAGSAGKIRIGRSPMSRSTRVKRGPLITLREGRILPQATRGVLANLARGPGDPSPPAPSEPDEPSGALRGSHHDPSAGTAPPSPTAPLEPAAGPGDNSLRTECRYAVTIAAAALASDPSTEHLADDEHVTGLWRLLESTVDSLERSFSQLAAVHLQELYAELERLESEDTDEASVGARPSGVGSSATPGRREAARRRERDRILALFTDHARTEREAAALQQRIVAACRMLESITPEVAVERLAEIEAMLSGGTG